jgi:subtilisin
MSAFGVVGVAYDCSLYAVKVMTHGSGDTDWIVAGLMWAADNKMNIASMSLWDNNGAVTPDEAPWEDIERAAQYAFNAGCLVSGFPAIQAIGRNTGLPIRADVQGLWR